MKVSIIITTSRHAPALARALRALRSQTYGPFEVVVVVNGPPSNETEQTLASCEAELKVVRCPEVNRAQARNAAIALASGDVVALLDDDAIPDPHWLQGLVDGYDSDRVAVVGGVVHENMATGPHAGGTATACDRNGRTYPSVQAPFWGYALPHPDRFLYLPGTNVSFRRRALEEVGGFDTELEHHLDEADLCLRLIDRGYELRLSTAAVVYDPSLSKRPRDLGESLRQPFLVVKDRTYFALRARPARTSVQAVQEDCDRITQRLLTEARAYEGLSADELSAFEEEVDRGLWVGSARGLHGARKLATFPPGSPEPFRPFATLRSEPHPLTLCLVSRAKPPADGSTVGRFTWGLARTLAARGHQIHFMTHSPDEDRLDFEEGVWVHGLRPERLTQARSASEGEAGSLAGASGSCEATPEVQQKLAHATAVHRAVRRLRQDRYLDLVVVPLRDAEGVYCLLDTDLSCVLNVQPSRRPRTLVPEVLALEQLALRSAAHVHALGPTALEDLCSTHGGPAAEADVVVVPGDGGEEASAQHLLEAYRAVINRRKAA
jgi:GT2 family glycosyltransferase